MQTIAWFLLIGPLLLGAWGLALLFNLFGAARGEAEFYRGRGEWYPVLDGDKESTHRLIGAVLVVLSALLVVPLLGTGVLS